MTAPMPLMSPPPPTGTYTAWMRLGALAQDLDADRALPGDDGRVVVGVDEREPLLGLQLPRALIRRVVGVAVEHDLGAPRLGRRRTLMSGVVRGITMTARQPSVLRRKGHALGMVAGAGGHHATRQLVGGQLGHPVVGAPHLEAEHRLLVLALDPHAVAGPRAEHRRELERASRARPRRHAPAARP